jgi:quinol monooxygenase YgiN
MPIDCPLVELRLHIKAQPVHVAEMVTALRSILLSARSERGFVSSHIYQKVDKPETLYYVEEWASPEQMEEQIISRRFGRLLAVMETAPRKPVLEVRSMSETRGLDYISTIRLGAGP